MKVGVKKLMNFCNKFKLKRINKKYLSLNDDKSLVRFWNKVIEEKDEHIIINGMCYSVGNTYTNGYSGRRFTIRKYNGEIITTNNLRGVGRIPKMYKRFLKDNAEFVNGCNKYDKN